jgi:hypothetical protein
LGRVYYWDDSINVVILFCVMAEEIWKDIIGYEGFYQVSNFGRVKSFYNNRHGVGSERILKQGFYNRGRTNNYKIVVLAKNKKHTTKTVHRLVATAFLDNFTNKPCINHKDGNTSNNFAFNLEWVTEKENSQDALKRGSFKHGSSCSSALLTRNQIIEIKSRLFGVWGEQARLAREYGISASLISAVSLNKIYKNEI